MENHDSSDKEMFADLAGRFGALAKFFGQLNSPEATERFIETLTSGDGVAFKQFADGLEWDMPNKCHYILEVTGKAASTPVTIPEVCTIRSDLSPRERKLYWVIRWKHRNESTAPLPGMSSLPGGVIAPGAFLDELERNGLVTCKPSITTNAVDPVIAFVSHLICGNS